MSIAGTVISYRAASGSGMIQPDDGSAPLPFVKAHFRQPGADPRPRQRFAFDRARDDAGTTHAVNLRFE